MLQAVYFHKRHRGEVVIWVRPQSDDGVEGSSGRMHNIGRTFNEVVKNVSEDNFEAWGLQGYTKFTFQLVQPDLVGTQSYHLSLRENQLSQLHADCCLAIHMAAIEEHTLDWESKYNAIFAMRIPEQFRQLGLSFDWYDPDTSYEDDVRAFISAVEQFLPKVEALQGTIS